MCGVGGDGAVIMMVRAIIVMFLFPLRLGTMPLTKGIKGKKKGQMCRRHVARNLDQVGCAYSEGVALTTAAARISGRILRTAFVFLRSGGRSCSCSVLNTLITHSNSDPQGKLCHPPEPGPYGECIFQFPMKSNAWSLSPQCPCQQYTFTLSGLSLIPEDGGGGGKVVRSVVVVGCWWWW